MGGLFYNLGKMIGPKVRQGKWVLKSLTGSEAEILEAERAVGKDMAAELAAQGQIDPNPALAKLLNNINDQLARRLRKQLSFATRALQTHEVNAYALPGGFVFVAQPLIVLCEQQQDELAFIVSHEMAHVIRGHAMDRIMNQAVLSVATRTGARVPLPRHKIAQLGLRLLKDAYSQDQELEADDFAVRLTRSAGFDPSASLRVLQRLEQHSGKAEQPEWASYFSSHPPFDLRMSKIKSKLKRKA